MESTESQADVERLLRSIQGLPCWYVSTGGAAGSTFQLALGAKVPRSQALRNNAHSEEYRSFEGEANLLVWCAWRLDGPDGPVASWDNGAEYSTAALERLVGATVVSVTGQAPAWDLDVRFSNRLLLRVFCGHVPPDPSFDGNWDLWLREQAVFIGPGTRCVIESRTQAEASAGK
jgi:hypothetical protein